MTQNRNFIQLRDVVTDLTPQRTVNIFPTDDVVDPTISTKKHEISVASIKKGFEVRILKRVRIEEGDLVFSKLHTQNGAFAFSKGKYLATTTFLPLFVHEDKINQKFLFWALHREIPKLLTSDTVGRETYKTEVILDIQIPLPPLEEQQRIVATLERLMARIKETHEERSKAREAATRLLEQIRMKIFQNLALRYDCEYLEKNADVQLGKMLSPKSKYGINPRPYLRNANIQWDRLDLSDVKSMDFDEREITKFTLENGDILVCEGGEIGRSAIWNNEIKDCLYQKALHRVRCKQNIIMPRFVLHALFWGQKTGKFFDLKTQTTIAHLPAIKLKKFPFPVPPLPDQRRIVAHLDRLQEKVDEVKRLQVETEKEMADLIPSILNKTFMGT